MDKATSRGNDFWILKDSCKNRDSTRFGKSIGVEEKCKVASHDLKALIIGGSKTTIGFIFYENDLRETSLNFGGGSIVTGVVNNNDFVKILFRQLSYCPQREIFCVVAYDDATHSKLVGHSWAIVLMI